MASQAERDCLSNPNFAVICSFMDRYADTLGLPEIGYKDLQEWVEDSIKVSPLLIDLHVRLLRRIHKKFSSVTADRWERGVVKFCYKYSNVDAWEIERFGYKLAKISTKLTLLKNLMESQFDCNNKFKDKINEIPIEDMRFQPIGRDKNGMAYWYFLDKELNLRVFREHQDDVDSESWELVCRNRDDLAKLVTGLEYGTDIKLDKLESSDQSEPVSDINEDSRDSFKQKTPLGPSPLTIKLEPVEGDGVSGDSKQPILLKINKSDIQSPSKMLKDKFVKEKGSEFQKIMCKMKKEGLVDSDNDDEDKVKDKECKADEVDGPVSNENVDEDKASLKCEILNKNGEAVENSEEIDNDKEIKKEVPNDNENVGNEENANLKIERKGLEISDMRTKDNEEDEKQESDVNTVEKQETDVNTVEKKETDVSTGSQDESDGEKSSKTEVHSTENDVKIKEKDCNNVSQITKDSETKDKSVPCAAVSLENETVKECNQSEEKDKNVTDRNSVDVEAEGTVCSEQKETCESEKTKEEHEIPQTNSIDKASRSSGEALETTKKEPSKVDHVEKENNGQQDKDSNDTADTLNDNKEAKLSEVALEPTVDAAVSSKTSAKSSDDGSEIIETSVTDKSSGMDKGESKTEMQHIEKIDKCDTASKKDEFSESQVVEQNEKNSDKDSKEFASEKLQNLETDLAQNVKVNTEESEHTGEKEQSLESKQPSDSANLENSENKSKTDTNIKKARKRKNDEIKPEVGNSSTDEEIDTECVHPSKRTIKTAVRKSPSKLTEEETNAEVSVEDKEKDSATHVKDEAEKEVLSETHEKEESDSKASCEGKESEKSVSQSDEKEVTDNVEETEEKEHETVKDNELEIDKKEVLGTETREENGKDAEVAEMDDKEELDDETENQSQKKVKGLVAHSRRSKSKAQKRQAENSDDMEPVEPASKKSKLRGRVTSRGRGKRRGVNFDSSSSDDDIPLSQMAGRGRGAGSRGTDEPSVGQQKSKANKDPPKRKKVEESQKANHTDALEIPADLSEDDNGRRRSARVRSMRARKQKSPSPDYVPSEFEETDDDIVYDDDEFTLKSKKRKKKEPKEVVEEIPKGRNALRHEAKTSKKGAKPIIEEEEGEAACVKCLRSHQPEWILLCDKCDAGYHTACLRPPLMIIPDGDWFCPPCEHTMLKEKLEEHLKSLDQAIVKNDRLVRRQERLAFVSVSLDNALKEPDPGEVNIGRKQKKPNYKESGDESDSKASSETGSSESNSESESYSEGERTHRQKVGKPKYIQRTCRTKKSVSYRFEEFDELIMDAIEEDLSIPKEPKPRKVKPPGISRGKDMSNILGASDGETEKKPVRKRRPRLTELDEDVDDDDTDDYQLSEASDASDATKSYESEAVSEDSIGSSWRYNSRSTRKSSRKGGRNRKYRDDFVVDSDFESDEDNSRRSRRRSKRGKVNYREINSDETEVEDNEDSFHSSELSDSDFERKRNKRIERKKKQTIKERPRSGKRQRIRRVSSSSDSSGTESDDSSPRKKIGKKPPSKSARYDSDETDQSVEKVKVKKSKKKKSQELSDMSESEAEETEETESSETEVSESDVKKAKPQQKKKNVIKSESEGGEDDEDKTDIEKENESHDSEEDTEGSGWEEIGVESDDGGNVTSPAKSKTEKNLNTRHKPKPKTGGASELASEEKPQASEIPEKTEAADIKTTENVERDDKNFEQQKLESDTAETMEETVNTAEIKEDKTASDVTPTKKKRGRKSKAEKGDDDETTTEEVTPKKRGRKPKPKPEPSEVSVEDTPVKKKRGRRVKSDNAAEGEPEINEQVKDKVDTDESVINEKKNTVVPEKKDEGLEKAEESQISGEQTPTEKAEGEGLQTVEKNKDDSPLSARNKQNAPVGVVKPEVRQGVIVENKQVIDSRLNENRTGNNPVNPLQGMRDLAMGNPNVPGTHPSSFTPYSQSNFGSQNMPGYMGQPGFQGYPHHVPPYSQGGPGPNHPYQGPPGMAPGAPPQYPPNQGPISPNSYQQSGSFIGQMQQGPPGFYPGNYRPSVGHPEGFRPSNPHGSQSPSFQHGQNPQYYHRHQTPYQGQGYPDHPGHYMGPQSGPVSHPQGGPGPYPGMPYNYPNMPHQGLQRPGFGPVGSPSMSPSLPVRPQTRLAGPTPVQQGSSPNPRSDNDPPNRGFMMDNILKPSPEGPSNDVEDSAEVSDIDSADHDRPVCM